jgi:hypothetical protein
VKTTKKELARIKRILRSLNQTHATLLGWRLL